MKKELLDKFELFADLDEQAKIIAAKMLNLDTVNCGDCLFQLGDDDSEEQFLIEGKIELVAADGRVKIIDAEDSTARFPLALLRPRKFTAVVESKTALILRLDIKVIQDLRNMIPVVGDAFSAFSPTQSTLDGLDHNTDDNIESIDKFIVGADKSIVDNRMMIANFDDVSTTIFNAIKHPDVSINIVVSAVQLDLAISAKMIKAANSAFYGGMQKVDSVRAAAVRLGLDLSVQLVTMMVMKEVFSSKNKSLQRAMQAIWQSAIQLACFSVVIGRKSKQNFQQGQTLLAGLMNDIGSLVIVAYLDQFPGILNNISDQVLSSPRIKKRLGTTLLKHWKFPDALIEALELSDDYTREQEQADLCDVVCLARVLVRRASYRKTPEIEITEMPSFQRLGFESNDIDFIHDIVEESGTYIKLFSNAV